MQGREAATANPCILAAAMLPRTMQGGAGGRMTRGRQPFPVYQNAIKAAIQSRPRRARAAVAAWFLRRSPRYPAPRMARRSPFPAKDGGMDGRTPQA